MFCPKCGAALSSDAKFCAGCGAQVQQVAQGAAAPTSATPAGSAPTYGAASAVSTAATSNPFRIARIVAGIILLACFFLPLYGLTSNVSVVQISLNVSALQMTFGIDVFGSHVDGSIENALFILPGILTLVGTFVLKGKAGDILAIIGGALAVILVFAVSGIANEYIGSYISVSFQLGAWLYILGGIACIVLGVVSALGGKK